MSTTELKENKCMKQIILTKTIINWGRLQRENSKMNDIGHLSVRPPYPMYIKSSDKKLWGFGYIQ